MSHLRLGTRGSPLALYQAHAVAAALEAATGQVCEIVVIRTAGDKLAEASLSEIGGKRLFVKEIEDALLSNEIDLAVHSSKDMPAVLPDGLDVAATLPREDARDALVLPAGSGPADMEAVLRQLGPSARLGTSSVRRVAQLRRLMPSASYLPIRGNLDTRLRKLDSGGFDAIVLACAGLNRLRHGQRISAPLSVRACVPAPGQGIIAVEIRTRDERTRQLVASIDDGTSRAALDAERAVVTSLGGGCQMPIGAHAAIEGSALMLTAVVVSLDGERLVTSNVEGPASEAFAIGTRAARDLLARGAREILDEIERAQNPSGGVRS